MHIKATKPRDRIPSNPRRRKDSDNPKGKEQHKMDPKAQSAAANNNPVYEDIEPFFEWHRDEGFDTLIVMLPGFRRDELKVQVTSAPLLKVSAQRQITENRWRRVYKEFPIPSDCDTSDLTAKFEAGTLKIKFPKLITPNGIAKPQETPTPERDEADDEKNGAREEEDQAKANKITDEAVSENTQKGKKPPSDDSTKGQAAQEDQVEKAKTFDNDEVSGKTPPSVQKEKEPAASDDFAKEKGKTTAAAAAAEEEGKQRAKNIVRRSKTRVLDFTLSLRPPADDQGYKEALAGLITGLTKMKKLMNLILVALLVVVLVLYVKNAFRSSLGGSQVQEL